MSYANGKLTIDLSAIVHNWLYLSARTSGAICASVIKADGYGLGMSQVATALYRGGCRTFFVATVGEGLAARACMPDGATIFVLQGFTDTTDLQACIESRLIPVLVHVDMIWHWAAVEGAHCLPCAIKLNTGMNRLGVSLEELAQIQLDPRFTALNLQWLMSHLACADEPASSFNQQQLDVFTAAFHSLRLSCPQVKASLANSAGILLGDAYHFDMVRPGIGLYGGQPTPSLPLEDVRSVVRLELPVIQLRTIQKGESVGYGRTFVATRETLVATMASGYAEGLLRLAGNRAQAWFHEPLLTVGRISMDSCAVDVTRLPESQRPSVGDYIEVLGPHIGVDDFAWHAETIAYEVLTGLSGRLERHYVS